MNRPRTAREKMSEWVLHCAVNQRHIRRSQPTREAALTERCARAEAEIELGKVAMQVLFLQC
jgi:hypothetical protein